MKTFITKNLLTLHTSKERNRRLKNLTLFFLGASATILVTNALTINTDITNSMMVIKNILLTSNGSPTGNTGVFLNGVSGSVNAGLYCDQNGANCKTVTAFGATGATGPQGPAGTATGSSSQWFTSGTSIGYSSGNVGIGTNSPTAKLEVVGDIKSPGFYSKGIGVSASGKFATAIGYNTQANGTGSISIGLSSSSNGMYSVAIGDGSYSNGQDSIAIGDGSYSNGQDSIAIGGGTANGICSIAMGISTRANGIYSTAMGVDTRANGYASTAIGQYNVGITGAIFEVGIGTIDLPDYRANALTILNEGNVGIGTTTPTAKLDVAGDIKANSVQINKRNAGMDPLPTCDSSLEGQIKYGVDPTYDAMAAHVYACVCSTWHPGYGTCDGRSRKQLDN